MKKKFKILGVIGIRSGSKGIKNKNILPFNGQPLVARILKTALKSKYINRLIISTDSKKYAKISKKYGAEIPFLRPKNLSGDKAHELEFINDLLIKIKKKDNYVPDLVVRLLATVPFQITQDIDIAIGKVLKNKKLDACFVVSEARQHPLKALKINTKNNLVDYFSGSSSKIGTKQNRNLFKKAYFRSNIIVSRINTIKKFKSLAGKKNGYHIIPQSRSIDIDSKEDFLFAEYIEKKL